MLTPFDDYPVHQTSAPIAESGNGHPDFYDRFWFNGYVDDTYFAVALGIYPNRGIIDAAFSVVSDGVQRSVFASGRAPMDRTVTALGPIRIEIIEPLRTSRIVVDAAEYDLCADLTFHARTPAYEEPRQTRVHGVRLLTDMTRASQLGTWTGSLVAGARSCVFTSAHAPYGTKDRSWGIRPVGLPAPSAPSPAAGQIFFLWAPLNFGDTAVHYMTFEDAHGISWAKTGVVLPVLSADDAVCGPGAAAAQVDIEHDITWLPGLRRAKHASLFIKDDGSGKYGGTVELEPLLNFRMKGAGYFHPHWAHGCWHDELAVGGECTPVDDLDNVALENIHVQQVVRARWGERIGFGVLEQLVIGPHSPSGFTGIADGARPNAHATSR